MLSDELRAFARAALAVAAKDLRIEVRAKEIIYSMIFFAGLVVLLFGYSVALLTAGASALLAAVCVPRGRV
jgi:ABC-type transport system involved in cytochrome c biogenesis permease component